MAELSEVWKRALPEILGKVTGRGVWTALNAAVPILLEDGVLALGLAPKESELGGHLRMPATSIIIERAISERLGSPVRIRVIDGTSVSDWEIVKRRDAERRRLQEADLVKMKAELQAKSDWNSVYEQLSRRYAAVSNRSLPQNRARFYDEAIEIVVEARKEQTNHDELGERNFARCLERIAQYTEIPSTQVAKDVLQRAGEL